METISNVAKARTQSLVARLATKFGVEPGKLLKCLTCQVFKQSDGVVPTNEEMMVLLLVCENYGLNPFNREIFAFRGKGGDIVPVVSLDGWARIVRSQKDFNGMGFSFSSSTVKIPGYVGELPEYVECSMRLKGIDSPVVVQEYMVECFNDRSPVWKKWPRRMLRTRAFIQCARLAFSLTGLYDDGEAFIGDDTTSRFSVAEEEPTLVAPPEVPKLALEKSKLDAMLTKLVTQAKAYENGWNRAQAWIRANLDGEDRSYAEKVLQKERFSSSEGSNQKLVECDADGVVIHANDAVSQEGRIV